MDPESSKRSRPEGSPSRVLFVRNLPADVSETELQQLFSPFGGFTKHLILSQKNQAFVQLSTLEQAQACFNYFVSVPGNVRGQTVYISYSARDEITPITKTETPSAVLLVTVSNLMYPITVDVLHQVFTRFGNILKIITFAKNAGELQSFIQFEDPYAATAAKNALSGLNIYSGCCTLKIQFSSMGTLSVKYNNERSRDYTNPTLPSGPAAGAASSSAPGAGGMGLAAMPMGMGYGVPPGYGAQPGYGAAPGYGAPGAGPSAGYGAPGAPGYGAPGPAVLLVNNLDEARVTPDHLFRLFGVFGDVLRVKILYNKKSSALLQFRDHIQAKTALDNLSNTPLFGRPLTIALSKIPQVLLPREGSEEATMGLTKDYSTSNIHRYKNPGSKNFQHINPPSEVLHVSNLPATVTEEFLRELFNAYGPIVSVNFLAPKDASAPQIRKMAKVRFSSIDRAVEALVNLENHSIESNHMRLSFTRERIVPSA